MNKPQADRIDHIPPAIAIEQSNPIKTSRSTVGTMTELADYLKLLFPRLAALTCPKCGRSVQAQTSEEIVGHILKSGLRTKRSVLNDEIFIVFEVPFPEKTPLSDALAFLKKQGFLRVLWNGAIQRTDEATVASGPRALPQYAPEKLTVIQDRIAMRAESKPRLTEAVESALRLGKGTFRVMRSLTDAQPLHFTNRRRCPHDQLEFKEPSPGLFSFNNPLGACPTCRGFGRVIEIDYARALPDRTLSIEEGVVKPWQTASFNECQRDLLQRCRKHGIRIDMPFNRLSAAHQRFVIEGEGAEGESIMKVWDSGRWYGVKGFFQWLETKVYKMHVRVLLSRYRAYRTCPDCHGARFQPTTLQWHVSGKNIAEINAMSLLEVCRFFEELAVPKNDTAGQRLRHEILVRLRYLIEVGLGYLTLDRTSRTLSGGEIERVNLTSCLGNGLTNTLFVLDEPSIGLHPRDNAQLIRVIHRLRDQGNTVVVVEHEESLMRAADHVIDLGPGRGENGGSVIYHGDGAGLWKHATSLTGQYLSGRMQIPLPVQRRKPQPGFEIQIQGACVHNLDRLDVDIPLGLLVVVTGVSGSGKSTLVHDVLCPALSGKIENGVLQGFSGKKYISDVLQIDQSPLTKTPRSNAAVYLGIYDFVRELFAQTESAQSQGLSASAFSFNTGMGRCDRCSGTGYERIEMQFLADVFVTCPACEGKRFQPHVLQVRYRNRAIHDVLEMTATEAGCFFAPNLQGLTPEQSQKHRKISALLEFMEQVGLGYLRLGQPLNQLSGGEAQRLKLLSCLQGGAAPAPDADTEDNEKQTHKNFPKEKPKQSRGTRLFVLDEPTTGLHFEDIRLLLQALQKLVDAGNSLLVIEHNLDVIKSADWVIDLGPEAGEGGGRLVAQGTPEQIAQASKKSHTGKFLKDKLGSSQGTTTIDFKPPSSKAAKSSGHGKPATIQIQGARHHNLKNISLDLNLQEMTVVTGLSGSGKSTLAFDILYAEGQRRYLDCLNAYVRQFVEQMEKPEVDVVTGIPPTVAIEQRVTRGGRKSTVATVTEIHQLLRLLFAKLGVPHDPATGEMAVRRLAKDICRDVERARGNKELVILAPLIRGRKGFHTEVARWAARKGHAFLRVDGKWVEPEKFTPLSRFNEHTIDVILGNIGSKQKPAQRRGMLETALSLGRGTLLAIDHAGHEKIYSTNWYCPKSGQSFEALDPRLFSFNSPHGWCPTCQGFGTVTTVKVNADTAIEAELEMERLREAEEDTQGTECPACHGTRINLIARGVRLMLEPFHERQYPTIVDLSSMGISEARRYFRGIRLHGRNAAIGRDILPEIIQRLEFLEHVGLNYLSLDRAAHTLSGGESQRIRLAAQLGSNLQGVLYVLDEPTIGLHPRDNERLLGSLKSLKEKGNTLVIVEHDEATMRCANRIVDLGPGAGIEGGRIVADGAWREIARQTESVTGQLIGNPMQHPMRGSRRPLDAGRQWLTVQGARANNLQSIDVKIPVGCLTVFCGVSGSGKSTLMHDVIKEGVQSMLRNRHAARHGGKAASPAPHPYVKSIEGAECFSGVYEVDQSPIGKTSRSTPATYLGVMDELRMLFSQVPLARQRGYKPGRFSYNSSGGRCEVCQGHGMIKTEMQFLPTCRMSCEACHGKRFNEATLEILWNGKNIAEVLAMDVNEAVDFFKPIPRIHRTLGLMREMGMGYLTLGQSSPTLSGGEAQRLKLVTELASSLSMEAHARYRRNDLTRRHLYLLEEPTIGLHLADVKRLMEVLHRLVETGHTVIVIEHHVDVVAEADYVVELGPEGGAGGGRIVASGTPEEITQSKKSLTAPFLKKVIQ